MQQETETRPDERTEAASDSTDQPEAAPSDSAEPNAGATEPESAAPDEPAAGPASDWPDLDRYRDELRAAHQEWSERLTTVQVQLASVAPALAAITAQYQALGVEEDLARLCQAVLGGAGMLQRVRFDFDLERVLTLAWPAAADPRPALASIHPEGEYRVDLWFGLGPDGQPRVRVEGEKRLEAPLPTTRERLRRVLLAAVQSPRYVSRAGLDENAGVDAETPSESPAGESDQPAAPRTPASAAGAASPEPPVQAQQAPESEPQPASEPSGEQPAPEAKPRPGDPEPDLPAEEMVIPLGPAEEKKPS